MFPFALSLSKGRTYFYNKIKQEGRGFDRLSPNGVAYGSDLRGIAGILARFDPVRPLADQGGWHGRRSPDRQRQYRRDQRPAHRQEGAGRGNAAARSGQGIRSGLDRGPAVGRARHSLWRGCCRNWALLPRVARLQGRQGRGHQCGRMLRPRPADRAFLRSFMAQHPLDLPYLLPRGDERSGGHRSGCAAVRLSRIFPRAGCNCGPDHLSPPRQYCAADEG